MTRETRTGRCLRLRSWLTMILITTTTTTTTAITIIITMG